MTTEATPKRTGRPPTGLPRKIRINVTLDEATIARAQLLGGGYVSTGIREAVKRCRLPFEDPEPIVLSPDSAPAGRIPDPPVSSGEDQI